MSSESLTGSREASLARSTVITVPWYRAALAGLLVLAGSINVVALNRVGLSNLYYATAVKSMLTSWHNFFFVSLDPGGFVTIDKPPLAFWLQAASAKLFGFSGISILLPEALAGVLSVLLLYYLVARVYGRSAGLLAGLALAVTPVMTVVNRSNLIESVLVLTMLLAAWAVTRATETGKLSWLLLGAVFVGLGFNEKMLEAYLVLPALILMSLIGSRVRWWTRLWHLVLAALVLLVVSLSWIAAVDLTPVSQRPYVGSSGNNSELSLALGYNGLGRLTGNAMSFLNGGTTLSQTISELTPTSLGFTAGETGGAGMERLVNAQLGGQAGWLILLALIGIVVVAWQRRPRFPLDQQQQGIVLWGAWLLTVAAFFSVAGFFHAYYLATLAPPVAALAGVALVFLWQDYRRPGWRGWALPLALLATVTVEAHILGYFPSWSSWLTPLVAGAVIVLALVLAVLRARRLASRPLALGVMALGVITLLLPSAVWSEYTVANAAGNMVPSAGPQARGGFGGFGGGPRVAGRRVLPGGFEGRFGGFGSRNGFEGFGGRDAFGGFPGEGRFGPAGGAGFAPGGFAGGRRFGGDATAVNTNLVHYLEAHQGQSKFLVATSNASAAEPFILDTDRPVMDLGGFMGADRILTVGQLAADVKKGMVRYFLISGGRDGFGGRDGSRFRPTEVPKALQAYLDEHAAGLPGGFHGGGFGGPGGGNADLTQWVSQKCSLVPAGAYHTVSPAGSFAGQQLYDCGALAASR